MANVADAMDVMPQQQAGTHEQEAPRLSAAAEDSLFFTNRPAGAADRRLALAAVAVSTVAFLACIPFATKPLAQVWAFIPAYQAALVVCDLVTAVLILGQARIARSVALMALGAAYLFCACLAVLHTLSFPGLLAPGGVLGGGAQTTAWIYMFWHAGFPLAVMAYGVLKGAPPLGEPRRALGITVAAVAAAAATAGWLATAGHAALPVLMRGNGYTPAMIFIVSMVWLLSLAALVVLVRREPYTVLQLWVMVVLSAWLFDVGLSAVFNAGRFDLGFYAGRIYGLLAATFVLVVLLTENVALHAMLARRHVADQRSLKRHADRLKILAAIDQAIIAGQSADEIAASVIQPLRGLLDVPRAIVNRFDLPAGQVEWVAAAGRRRTHVGSGVRYSLALMGDAAALARGEPQFIDVHALPQGREAEALLASGVRWYMAVPMIAGGELIGALSFGDDTGQFDAEQRQIAQEVAAQLAIATAQSRLLERVRAHAAELEEKVRSRTEELESFSYSVSHDLRAPLRAINGYAQMLEEDYADRLDAEGQRLLGVVRDNAHRMGRLIDDLLAFARLGRQQPVMRPVDMTSLAREVAQELLRERLVAIEIEELPRANADVALLRQVWVNLIGNAIKYSAKKPAARVVVSAREEGAANVYAVRDNGAGFDMRYVEKLFGVFQRLHRTEEFEGTGVGLAIVQRIVSRHGGRVWAEGKPGEGACFSFSLPMVDA